MRTQFKMLIIFCLGLIVCTIASTSAGIDQVDSKTDITKNGRWKRVREPLQGELDEESFSKLMALGYLQGYNPAPPIMNVVINKKEQAYNGLNFYVSGHAPEALLIDMDGNSIHRWHYKNAQDIWPDMQKKKRGSYWRRAHLYRNGDVLAIYEGIGLIKINKDSQLVWSYSDQKKPHHDIAVAGDGKIYILTREYKVVSRINPKAIFEDFITILTPEGKVIKHISLLVLLENSPYARLLDEGIKKSRGFLGDIFHTNTLELFNGELTKKSYLFKKGNVMVSVLNLNSIFIIDMDSERIVWALGSGMWERQHQPTLLENGNILIFDNHYTVSSSQIIEFEPMSQEIVWNYRGNDNEQFFSRTCGSNQRLPNGNTLITETDFGRVFEVTRDKEIVWEFISPYRAGENNELIATIPEMIRLDPRFFLFLTCIDTDSDGFASPAIATICEKDNCPTIFNPLQKDGDNDGVGDACDNCPSMPNGPDLGTCILGRVGSSCANGADCGIEGICSRNQENCDSDELGDVCDLDDDNDGTDDGNDTCPYDAQNDSDSDGICGDADNCPEDHNPNQEDRDKDGIGDACDLLQLESHWIEAEGANTIVSPLAVANEGDTSEGRYLYSPNEAKNQFIPGPIMAVYRLNIEQEGVYILWGRVKVSDKNDNSFFVQVDDGMDNLWEIEPGDYWHWDKVNHRDVSDPVEFILTRGIHTINVKLREDGTMLDKLLLTNDLDFVPSGKGDAAENSDYSKKNGKL